MDDFFVNIKLPDATLKEKINNVKPKETQKVNKESTKCSTEKLPSNNKITKTKQNSANPLQVGIDNKRSASASKLFTEILNQPIKPNIEPVFSEQTWKSVCESLKIHPHLSSCITERFKLSILTAIQNVTIPSLMSGKDVLVRAQTGSGKTLAYAVPLWNSLSVHEPPITRIDGPLALIILPTRELAVQTYDVFRILSQSCIRIVPGIIIGGMKRKSQKASLRKGINVVIGTPQRIIDHLGHTSSLNLKNIRWLVIDEADRLLEMGFERDVKQIIMKLVDEKQNLENPGQVSYQTALLSATLTSGVEELAGLALKNPVKCIVDDDKNMSEAKKFELALSLDLKKAEFALPSGLKHFVVIVPWKLRLISLAAFLLLKCKYHDNGGKLIVFMATQDCIDFHYQLFKAVLCEEIKTISSSVPVHQISVYRLHGNMEHKDRETEFQNFSKSHAGVLLTTDVASRGLDLAAVSWVVQYHVTGSPVDYVHRVGRTARAGGRGKALLFLDSEEAGYLNVLRSRVGIELEELNLSDLLQAVLFHLKMLSKSGRPQHGGCATVEEGASRLTHLFMSTVLNDELLAALAQAAYISFLRAYASFSHELRQNFDFKRLHMGHVARTFCLNQKPSDIATKVRGTFVGKSKTTGNKRPLDVNDENGMKLESESDKPKSVRLSFDETKRHSSSAKRNRKPTEIARLNMLAEYGL